MLNRLPLLVLFLLLTSTCMAQKVVVVTVKIDLTPAAHAQLEEYRTTQRVTYEPDAQGDLQPVPMEPDVTEMLTALLLESVDSAFDTVPTAAITQKRSDVRAAEQEVRDAKRSAARKHTP